MIGINKINRKSQVNGILLFCKLTITPVWNFLFTLVNWINKLQETEEGSEKTSDSFKRGNYSKTVFL